MKIPKILSCHQQDSTVVLQLWIDDKIEYFNGHFDSFALLPGVAQLDWVFYFAQHYLDFAIHCPHNIDSMKFSKMIKPNSTVNLTLKLTNRNLQFTFHHDDEICSTGKITQVLL